MSTDIQSSPSHAVWLEKLHPAYFALVMATGIISITSQLHGHDVIARVLLGLNLFQFTVLMILYVTRLFRFRAAFLSDASHHLRGPGYFTVVAGTGVLTMQLFIVAGKPAIATGFGALTVVLWCIIVYSVFALLIVKAVKPPIEEGINGGWLVGVVATQSVALVSVQMGKYLGLNEPLLILGGFLAWCFGVMFYLWIISLIFYRYMFFAFKPGDLSPPYWINMGAVAISTLAGCSLISAAHAHPLLMELRPFIKGVTFLLWSTATWWIPMLVILGFWRHVIQRFPMRYDPLYWGLVFPLGMYSACTFRMAEEYNLPMLLPLAKAFLIFGIFAWTVVFTGLLRTLIARPKPILAGGT